MATIDTIDRPITIVIGMVTIVGIQGILPDTNVIAGTTKVLPHDISEAMMAAMYTTAILMQSGHTEVREIIVDKMRFSCFQVCRAGFGFPNIHPRQTNRRYGQGFD